MTPKLITRNRQHRARWISAYRTSATHAHVRYVATAASASLGVVATDRGLRPLVTL